MSRVGSRPYFHLVMKLKSHDHFDSAHLCELNAARGSIEVYSIFILQIRGATLILIILGFIRVFTLDSGLFRW